MEFLVTTRWPPVPSPGPRGRKAEAPVVWLSGGITVGGSGTALLLSWADAGVGAVEKRLSSWGGLPA